MCRAPRAGHLGPRDEVEDDVAVVEVPDHGHVGRGQTTQNGRELGGTRSPLVLGERSVTIDETAEWVRPPVLGDERLGAPDHVETAVLALVARLAPRRQPVAAQDAADRGRICSMQGRDVEAELEAGSAPVDPQHLVTEAALGQLRTIDRGREGDDRVGMEMVDVHRIDERMHRRIDARRRGAATEEAVVEQANHLVLVLWSAVDTDEPLHAAEFQRGQAGLAQRPEVSPEPLTYMTRIDSPVAGSDTSVFAEALPPA